MARQSRKTAAQVAQKWSTNLQQAVPSVTQGVNAVTTSPGVIAANNPQGYLAGVQANVAKWQRKTGAVTLQDWKTAMTQKGIPHMQQGAAQAQQKVQTAMAPVLDAVYNLRDQINSSMPRGTLQQNLARMNAMVNGMAQYNSGH